MKSPILFDLGDTLIYRNKSHLEYDTEWISHLAGANPATVKTTLLHFSIEFPGVYATWKDNHKITTLVQEKDYLLHFFTKVTSAIKFSYSPETLVESRFSQPRYQLFPDAQYYLSQLRSSNYPLGIFTNGRPSRRIILKQLQIENLFLPNLVFISDEIGSTKPNQSAYDYVTSLAKTNKIILCDDELPNITEAEKLGWKGLRVNHKQKGFQVLDYLINQRG